MSSIRNVYGNLFEGPVPNPATDSGYVQTTTDKNGVEYIVYAHVAPHRPATGASMSHAGGDPAEGGMVDEIEGVRRVDGTKETELTYDEWSDLFSDSEQRDLLVDLNNTEPEYDN